MHYFTFARVLDLIAARREEFLFILGALVLELWVRTRRHRPMAWSFLTDLFYCFFYRLGIFTFLFDSPVRSFLHTHLLFQIFTTAPLWVRVAVYVLVLDLTNYWVHRWQHSSPILWPFHQIHHSQSQLSVMTTYRTHPVDAWMRSVIGPAIFMILLGIPPAIWFPLALLWDIVLNLSHVELDWNFQPFHRLFVSPMFHAVHHSTDPGHYTRNFGMTLSVWDYLFGTALTPVRRPAEVGLVGWNVRESVWAHLIAPLRALRQQPVVAPGDVQPPVGPGTTT